MGEGWLNKVLRYIAKDVGAVEGVSMKSKECVRISRYERGCLLATLIRKSAVQDWTPRRGFESNFEDYDITQHIITKGLRWLRVNVPGTIHLNIHPHASIEGFKTLMGPGFTIKERALYIIHLLKLMLSLRISLDMMLQYIRSILSWLRKT